MTPPQVEWKEIRSPAGDQLPITIDLKAGEFSPRPPMRTYSLTHPQAGFLEFTVPYMNPEDVEAYLAKKLADLPVVERMTLHNALMKTATFMWEGYALWLDDPAEARLQLRGDEEVSRWFRAKEAA